MDFTTSTISCGVNSAQLSQSGGGTYGAFSKGKYNYLTVTGSNSINARVVDENGSYTYKEAFPNTPLNLEGYVGGFLSSGTSGLFSYTLS